MARPKKDNADYFTHDRDMRNDNKLKAVRRKYTNEGYAIWNMLLEHLTDCDFFEYEYNDLNVELLSGDFDIEPALLKEMIEYFIKVNLLVLENGFIKSLQLIKRFESLLNRRKRQVKPIKPTLPTTETPLKRVIDVDNPHSREEYSKEEKSIVEEKEIYKAEIIKIDKTDIEYREKEFINSLLPYIELFGKEMIREFHDYWTEKKPKGRKFRFEMEKTWDVKRRLDRWDSNNFNHKSKNNGQRQKISDLADELRKSNPDL